MGNRRSRASVDVYDPWCSDVTEVTWTSLHPGSCIVQNTRLFLVHRWDREVLYTSFAPNTCWHRGSLSSENPGHSDRLATSTDRRPPAKDPIRVDRSRFFGNICSQGVRGTQGLS